MSPATLVFRFHKNTRYSIAALLGAVENDSRLQHLQLTAPPELDLDSISKVNKDGLVVIAYSILSTDTTRVRKEVQLVRKHFGNSVILIAGGAHTSARPIEVLQYGFDFVVIGEGEKALCDLLDCVIHEKEPNGIPGVVSGEIDNPPAPKNLPTVDLDEYPPFAVKMNVVGPIEVTRGCPYRCKFCSTPFLSGGRVRHRSIETIIKWLQKAVTQRGFSRTWFLSPNALCYGGPGRRPAPEKLEALLQKSTAIDGLEEVYFGSFPSEVRPEFVDSDILTMMRKYVASETLQIGLQSGSNEVLRISNRQHTVSEGMSAIRTALDCGFVPHVDMIFGLPGESQDDARRSLETCHTIVNMGGKIHAHVFMPLPGSEFEYMSPGKLDSHIRAELGELARKGVLTGSWYQQEQIAQRLASSD
ncbi:MAG: TIGR04013 family B12-binding domain/radical SAM domain-containing protein [Candidatus Thorarchaeota archaeon]